MKPDLIAAVDAAMLEMQNISPPLKRSECERLIRAALSAPAEVAQGEVLFSQFLTAVMDAAGLVRHGRQSKELSEYLGKECIRLRLMNSLIAPPSPGAELVELLLDVQACRKLTSLPLKIAFMESRNMNSLSDVAAFMREVNARIDAKLASLRT